jgi:RimJ/RimL family protein N-acetyltransferase
VAAVVRTARLVLRPFTDVDRAPFAALNTHPLVVELLGSSASRAESDAMVDRFSAEMDREGWGLWAVEVDGGAPFIGMVGLHRMSAAMPMAPGIEIGWRLHPDHWGHGYASEAAQASLDYGFGEGGLSDVVAFTTTVNTRSQAVMERIGMTRDLAGDFDHPLLPEGSPLRRHVLYRISAPVPPSQAAPSVAP